MSVGNPASPAAPVESLPRAVVEIQEELSRCANIGELLGALARGLRPLLPVTDRVSLVFVEPDGETMRIYRLLPPLDEPPSPLPRVRIEGTPVGRTVREGVGRVVGDVRTDPNITFGHASRDRIRSTLSAPIRVGGRVVGALNAGSRIPGTCDEPMLRELQELVSIVGPTVYAAERVIAESQPQAPRDEPAEPAAPPPTARTPRAAGSDLVGQSPSFRALIDAAQRAADADVDVVITGETGVGKSALARAIHDWSTRKGGPFVTVQLADLTPSLIESELFGHERGAFTGALAARAGRFERAHGGTILLDEIGEADPAIQAKILRVIQERSFERVGGGRTRHADVRVVAATSRDLGEAIERGEFRRDLFYRLNVVPLHVPALRDRMDDLEPLVASILERLPRADGGPRSLSPGAWRRIRAHAWPGNIRELESVLRRAAILESGDPLTLECLSPETRGTAAEAPAWPTLEDHQRRYIVRVLEVCGGIIEGPGGAAHMLGLRPSTLRSRMQKLGVSASAMREERRSA